MNDALSVSEKKDTIRKFIINNFLFGVENEALTDSSSFLETGIIDSTGILELITFVETEYGIDIKDGEMLPENLDSLDNLSAFITKKKI